VLQNIAKSVLDHEKRHETERKTRKAPLFIGARRSTI
jgi:hypothetical protein